MDVRLWRTYACNNSADFKLVGQFQTDDEAATAAAAVCDLIRDTELSNDLVRGDGEAEELVVAVVGATVLVHSPYCLGFTEWLPAQLGELGGQVASQYGKPRFSVRFATEGEPARSSGGQLTDYFRSLERQQGNRPPHAPWRENGWPSMTELAWYADGSSCGFSMVADLEELGLIRDYLADAGADLVVTLEDEKVHKTYTTVRRALCPECQHGGLVYLPADDLEVDADTLLCRRCGGMFALDNLWNEQHQSWQ